MFPNPSPSFAWDAAAHSRMNRLQVGPANRQMAAAYKADRGIIYHIISAALILT